MSARSMPEPQLLDLGAEGEGQNDAVSEMASDIAGGFASQLKRTLPFLARQRASVEAGPIRNATDPELEKLTDGPGFLLILRGSEGAWASLQLDAEAIAALLDGLFVSSTPGEEDGGEDDELAAGDDEDEEDAGQAPQRLTIAQRALLERLCSDIAQPLTASFERATGVTLARSESQGLSVDETAQLPDDACFSDCGVAGPVEPWRIRVALGTRMLSGLVERPPASESPAVSMESALASVPLDVVAELGRVTLKLHEVLDLRRGDTLRLPSATNDPVLVRVQGVPKFRAVPVISRGQIAVKVDSRCAP